MKYLAYFIVLLLASPLVAADFDKNGSVTFNDYILFAQRYGSVSGDGVYAPEFDLDNNDRVDRVDFILFAEAFGESHAASKAALDDLTKDQLEALAKAAWSEKDYSSAAQRYRQFLARVTKPEDKAHGLKALGTTHVVLNNLEQAKTQLKKLFADYDKSKNQRIRSKLAEGSALLGYIYHSQGDAEKSLHYWRQIKDYLPPLPKGK